MIGIVRLSPEGNKRIGLCIARELQHVWKKIREKTHRKVQHMVAKQNPIRDSVMGTFEDILIGDSELEERYGETIPKVAVHGGIDPSPNVISFLRLPANLRLFDKIEKIIGEKKVEEAAVKDRWEERNKEDRENSGGSERR